MLTADITKDYLLFDFLEPVTYYRRIGEGTFADGVVIERCWFQDTTRGLSGGGTDLKRKTGSVVIWMNEWPDDTLVPRRGDAWELAEPQHAGAAEANTTNRYLITEVIVDPLRSQAMRFDGYRLTGS